MDTRASTLRLFVFIGTCIISFVGFERKVSLMFIIIGHISTCLHSIFSFMYNYIQLFRISENCFSLCLSVYDALELYSLCCECQTLLIL